MRRLLALILALSFAAITAVAQPFLRLPSIIGDHMVLQENSDVKIFGWCDPNTTVTVETSWGETAKIKSGYDTEWSVTLHTPASSDRPASLTVTTSRKVTKTVNDILIGQVWLCSGQSNMNWSAANGIVDMKEELTDKMPEQIRLFTVTKCANNYKQMDVEGKWVVCNKDDANWFSAVGYFFGKKLHESLSQPVGLINSSWGGTPVEFWTPRDVISKREDMVASWKSLAYAQRSGWNIGNAYNAMIWPLRNFKIAGVIWYQGEANKNNADLYAEEFTMMIESWRKTFSDDKLPFYFVQIAPYLRKSFGRTTAYVREAQEKVWKTVANTGMVCVSDQVDDVTNIHPRYKKEVGNRLANMALAQTYGKTGFKYNCPTFKAVEFKKGKAIVTFNDAEGGIVCNGSSVVGLEIAGADMKFVPATGMVDEKKGTLTMWSNTVREPAAVRYCFSDGEIGNLFDVAGLPVAPFRSDSVGFGSSTTFIPSEAKVPAVNASDVVEVTVRAAGMEVKTLGLGTIFFTNRQYKVTSLPENLKGWQMLSHMAADKTSGECTITAAADGKIYILARANKRNAEALKGWMRETSAKVTYATHDPEKPGILSLYFKDVKAGQKIILPASADFAGFTVISTKINY